MHILLVKEISLRVVLFHPYTRNCVILAVSLLTFKELNIYVRHNISTQKF